MALIVVSGFSKNVIESSFDSESFASIEFDGYLNVTPAVSNIITKRPIEDGFDLIDGVHNSASILAVEIIITDTAQTIIDKRAITNLPNILGTKFFKTHTRRQLDSLQDIVSKKGTVNLKTKYGNYEGYYIQDVAYSETSEQALRISFTMIESRTDIAVEASENISDSIGLWS